MDNLKTDSKAPIKSILAIVLGFIVIFLLSGLNWLLCIAIAFICVALISDRLMGMIHSLWMKLAGILGFVVPKVILILIFYCILFPLSLLAKLFRKKDPLNLKNKSKSTFITTHKVFSKQSFENPW